MIKKEREGRGEKRGGGKEVDKEGGRGKIVGRRGE